MTHLFIAIRTERALAYSLFNWGTGFFHFTRTEFFIKWLAYRADAVYFIGSIFQNRSGPLVGLCDDGEW
jgi:hypothetical protein